MFLLHPREVGETYREHWRAAAGIGARLIRAGLACWLHAWVPGWCTRTASHEVLGLARQLEARIAASDPGDQPAAARAGRSSELASLQSRSRS